MRLTQPAKRAIGIEISNRQTVCRLARRRITALLAFLLRKSRRPADAPENIALTLVVTDDRHMPEFKQRCFGVHEVTDVIAAAYDSLPGESSWEADLVVNAERAAGVAAGRIQCGRLARFSGRHGPGWDVSSEFALYLAHGVNHLTGADDATPRDRRRMRRRELRWLHEARKRELLRELLAPAAKRVRQLS